MIIWINGAFGSGKTSVAEAISKKISLSFIYDPENVGYFLWNVFPENMKRKGNFQHINMWREFNFKILKYMNDNYNGVIIVPMTIYTKQYYDEMIGELKNDHIQIEHFILSATKQTITNRLIGRGESENSWAEQHIDICIDAFDNEIPGKKINTELIDIDEVASVIIEYANLTKYTSE